MQKQEYPYCIHGCYVGGCGADYMCGACEMGDPAPSVKDLLALRARIYSKFARQLNIYTNLVKPIPSLWNGFHTVNGDLIRQFQREIDALNREIRTVHHWSEHGDDHAWIYRRHDHNVRIWHEASGDEQFWSLPASVLDGA